MIFLKIYSKPGDKSVVEQLSDQPQRDTINQVTGWVFTCNIANVYLSAVRRYKTLH